MGLRGGGRPGRVALAVLAITLLTWAAAIGTRAEGAAPIQDCLPQATVACGGMIYGRAFIDHEHDRTFQPEAPHFDAPQDGIVIRLTDGEGATYDALSDADGCYAFTSLGAGIYSITTWPSPTLGLTRLHEEPLHITLRAGEVQEVLLRYDRDLIVRPSVLYLPIAAK